MSETLLLTWCN